LLAIRGKPSNQCGVHRISVSTRQISGRTYQPLSRVTDTLLQLRASRGIRYVCTSASSEMICSDRQMKASLYEQVTPIGVLAKQLSRDR
jgi:hypothetical protein